MILVMLGTQNNSFHRLLDEVQKCIDKKIITEQVIVQAGKTKYESKDMKIFGLIPEKEINKYIKEANYIITHGGVGSIISCIKKGKKVIAVPRYQKYEEHVNDHQKQIIETFAKQELIKGIENVEDLEQAIKEIENFKPQKFVSQNEKILNIVKNNIDNDKKILFSAYSLDLGGIEKALVTLANKLQSIGFRVTIVLEKKEGIFLEQLNPKIKLKKYSPSNNKIVLIRKIQNLLKRIIFTLGNKNKYHFSASFATYSKAASFVARTASKNTCLWGHANYLTLFNGDKQKVRDFFEELNYSQFKNIVFVSEEGRKSFIEIFPEMEKKTITCNNLIENKKIVQLSKEKIDIKKEEIITFLNVGRHDEKQKKLTRLIEASKKLKQEGYKFKVLLVGEGPDTNTYKELVKKENLEDCITFLGKKQNPYPYFKISDCVILTSDYEGYPVVFLESFVLNKPLITTKVSDYEQVEGKFGKVTEKDVNDIYEKMKQFIENGFEIPEKFKAEKYNEEIVKKICEIIG